jgi:hypothetical protein
LLAAAALACAAARSARAGIDVEVPASFRAKSALDAGETETYRFHAEKGTLVSLSVAAAKGADLAFTVDLLDGAGDPVTVPAGVVTDLGKRVSWRDFEVPATDDYRIDVSATGSGAYGITFSEKPRAKWTGTLVFPDAGPLTFPFSAPVGAKVSIVARTSKGSAASPLVTHAAGPCINVDLSSSGKRTPTSHSLSLGVLAAGGDFTLTVANFGSPGSIDVAVSVKRPRAKTLKMDLRGVALGRPSGGETLVARTVGSSGGVVSVDDPGSDLVGASVAIPGAALGLDTLISLASSAVPPLGSPDDQAAGPAVDLRPPGTTFAFPAAVTLPFDPARVPADATPADIRVRIVEADGSAVEVAPDSVDAGAGTVTVSTSGFSVCVPVVYSGAPRLGLSPGGDEFWLAALQGDFSIDAGNDSRGRDMVLDEGEVSFHSDGTFQVSSQRTTQSWTNGPDGMGGIDGTISPVVEPRNGTVDWAYGFDGQTVQLVSGDTSDPVFAVSRDGTVLASRPVDGADAKCKDAFLIRKPAQAPTLASAAGTYPFVGFEYNANTSGGGIPAGIGFARSLGTVTLAAGGGATISFSSRRAEFDAGAGKWTFVPKSGTLTGGTVVVEAAGTLLATFPPDSEGDGPVLRLYPGRDMKVMFCTEAVPKAGKLLLFVLVREGSGLSRSDLDGTWRGAIFKPDLQTYAIPGPISFTAPDYSLKSEGDTVAFTGGATATVAAHGHIVQRDSLATGGVGVQEADEGASVSVSVSSAGKVVLASTEGSVVGWLGGDGSFLALGADPASTKQKFLLGILVRSPPHK